MENDFCSHPASVRPVCNVTIPVFNRPLATTETILALRRTSQEIPFDITVVDNGSDEPLALKLRELEHRKIIDHLYRLPRNMGVAAACNIGWELVDAGIYMKLDNDTAMRRTGWLNQLLRLWENGMPKSNLGGAFNLDMLRAAGGCRATQWGELGICTGNLPGQAILIPKCVSDEMGMWNEEYGLYGGEDADYGLRMLCAGLPQYYYLGPEYFENLPGNEDAAAYSDKGIDKRRLHRELAVNDNLFPGRLLVNKILYSSGKRPLRVQRRYRVDDVDDTGQVRLSERREYRELRRAMQPALAAFNKKFREHIVSFRPDDAILQSFGSIFEMYSDC